MSSDIRRIVESVLGGPMTAKVWTSNYAPVFPFTPQHFSVGALLPMILYLFRWGHRRGKGRFRETFGESGPPTVQSVTDLLTNGSSFSGFSSPVGKAILGDMLLTSAIENRRRSESRDEQILRCFAGHYMASWIDLPIAAAHLRGVPEMIVALVADQSEGENVDAFRERGRYPVGSRVEDNELLRSFAPGISTTSTFKSNVRADQFDEEAPLSLDQLLLVRIAQACGEAPAKASGKGEPGPISNQRPIATHAADDFRDDLLVFLDCYAGEDLIPRTTLLAMIESGLAVGLTSIMLETVAVMIRWSDNGMIPEKDAMVPFPIMIDASGNADTSLRDISERSNMLFRQALNRLPAILMHARLLDYFLQKEGETPVSELPSRAPVATEWLNLLGSLLNGSHDEARDGERFFRRILRELRDRANQEEDGKELADLLGEEMTNDMHARVLAEVLSSAFALTSGGGEQIPKALASALMTDEPNGLAKKRKVSALGARRAGQRRTEDAVSFVLSNTVLEYLVHRHLRRNGKGRKAQTLSYPQFLRIMRERYGFFVDQSPPNLQVPNDLLQRNRKTLERRLRDLGLLTGVNDAESMKKLKARYHTAQELDSVEAETT